MRRARQEAEATMVAKRKALEAEAMRGARATAWGERKQQQLHRGLAAPLAYAMLFSCACGFGEVATL